MAKPASALQISWPPKRDSLLLSFIFAAAFLLYLFHARYIAVGSFADDARDLLAAKSLLHGRYASLQDPNTPPINFPLPGFPLLLAPFVAALGPHWALIKIVPIAATLGSGFLFWSLLEGHLKRSTRFVLLLLFLFNPCTLFVSGIIMADSFFVCLMLAAFHLLPLVHDDAASKNAWILGGLLAWAAMVRPEGMLLVFAVSASLLYAGRRKALWGVLGPAAVVIIAWACRNVHLTGHASGYSLLWQMSLRVLANTSALILHWLRSVVSWFWELMAGISFGNKLTGWIAGPAMAAGVLAVWGFFSWLQKAAAFRSLVLAVGLFSGLFVALHAVWLAVHPHYFFPLLPLSLIVLTKAFEEGERRRHGILMIGGLTALCVGSVYAIQDVQTFSSESAASTSLSFSTLDWIKTHIAKDADHRILAARAPTVTLYTDRFSTAFIPARDAEQFRFELLTQNISHALVEPASILFVSAPDTLDPVKSWDRIPLWLAGWPEAFHMVFEQSESRGRTTLYEVISSTRYVAAYTDYRTASECVAQGKMQEGLMWIERALKTDPELTSALNGYAAIAIESGGPLDVAETRLKTATRLRPDFALAWLNLARLHEKQHRAQEAAREYAMAEKLVRTLQ